MNLYVDVGTDSSTQDLGIFRGGEEITYVAVELTDILGSFANYESFNDTGTPSESFFNGTYSIASQGNSYISTENWANKYYFNVNSLTISGATAIPEPQTHAMLIGALSLVFVAVRRRRGKQKPYPSTNEVRTLKP